MRETSMLDHEALRTLPEFDEATLASVRKQIDALAHPAGETPRKLDAAGILNLWAVYERMTQRAGTEATP